VADETGAGQGLIGIRERIELHGGEMLSGTTSSGGFALRARLPLFALPASTDSDDAVPASTEDAGPALWQRFRTRVDGVISLAWLVPLEIEAVTSTHRTGPMAVGVAVVAGMALAGLIRRRAPISFLVTAGALSLVLSGGIASPQHASVVNAYIVVFGAYTVAAYCPQPRALAGLAFLLAGAIVTTVVHHAAAGVALGGCLLACAAWITGRIVRNQRQIIADLATATARLSAERDSRALMARAAERVRIARDLQAIVARLVVTMVVQAESAEDQLAHDPVRAVEAIAGIEHMGRGALVQLRQILGVLRNRAGAAPQSSPQRGQQVDTVLDELVRVPS
jgi:signal transduction histidine kinase